MIAIITVIR